MQTIFASQFCYLLDCREFRRTLDFLDDHRLFDELIDILTKKKTIVFFATYADGYKFENNPVAISLDLTT